MNDVNDSASRTKIDASALVSAMADFVVSLRSLVGRLEASRMSPDGSGATSPASSSPASYGPPGASGGGVLSESLKTATAAVRELSRTIARSPKDTPGKPTDKGISPASKDASVAAKGRTEGAPASVGADLKNAPGMGVLGSVIGTVGPVLKGMGTAALATADALKAVVTSSLSFVEAFNPSTVMVFNQIVRDITAVIGSALVPVVRQATTFLRDFGSRLLPVVEQLRPVFETLSAAVGKAAGFALNVFSSLARGLMPLYKVLAELTAVVLGVVEPLLDVVGAVAEIVGVIGSLLSVVVKVFVEGLKPIVMVLQLVGDWFKLVGVYLRAFAEVLNDTFKELLGMDSGGVWNGVREAMQKLMVASALLTYQFLRFVGLLKMADAVEKATRPTEKKDATGFAAATNASFKSFSDFGRQVSLAASTAKDDMAGGPEPKTDDFLKQINDGIQSIKAGDATIIDKFAASLASSLITALTRTGGKAAYDGVASASLSPLKFLPGFGLASTLLSGATNKGTL